MGLYAVTSASSRAICCQTWWLPLFYQQIAPGAPWENHEPFNTCVPRLRLITFAGLSRGMALSTSSQVHGTIQGQHPKNQPVEKLGRAGREKISERVRVEMTVVLLTVASRWKSASSGIYAIKPVELLVRDTSGSRCN
jgi:hypothetical protein